MAEKIDLKGLTNCEEDGIFRPEKLAMVHVTSYMPQKVEDHYEIQSTSEATDYHYLRNTIHFTVGHHVEANTGGSWDGKGIMVVAPMKGIIDKNGIPLGMSSEDTYFETIPGRNLELPQGTHFFVPATDEKKLSGNLSYNEGDMTYYKSSGFTDSEKEDIFWEMTHPNNPYREEPFSLYNKKLGHSEKVTLEKAKKLPDDFFAFQLKKLMLKQYLNSEGYVENKGFDHEGSDYAKGITKLGKKLGCRFCSDGGRLHYWSDFTDIGLVTRMTELMNYADTILHPDSYDVVSRPFKGETSGRYILRKKESTLETSMWSHIGSEEENFIQKLKEGFDFTQDLTKIEEEYGHEWTSAFKKTFDVWKQKSLKRLSKYYEKAKGFDFEKAHQQLKRKMEAFDKASDGLLTRAFARQAKTSEREKHVKALLRERDATKSKLPVSLFKKQNLSSK